MKMLIGSNQGREGDTPSLSEIAIKKESDITSGYLQKLVLDKATA
jgi:hypothetical protein